MGTHVFASRPLAPLSRTHIHQSIHHAACMHASSHAAVAPQQSALRHGSQRRHSTQHARHTLATPRPDARHSTRSVRVCPPCHGHQCSVVRTAWCPWCAVATAPLLFNRHRGLSPDVTLNSHVHLVTSSPSTPERKIQPNSLPLSSLSRNHRLRSRSSDAGSARPLVGPSLLLAPLSHSAAVAAAAPGMHDSTSSHGAAPHATARRSKHPRCRAPTSAETRAW